MLSSPYAVFFHLVCQNLDPPCTHTRYDVNPVPGVIIARGRRKVQRRRMGQITIRCRPFGYRPFTMRWVSNLWRVPHVYMMVYLVRLLISNEPVGRKIPKVKFTSEADQDLNHLPAVARLLCRLYPVTYLGRQPKIRDVGDADCMPPTHPPTHPAA